MLSSISTNNVIRCLNNCSLLAVLKNSISSISYYYVNDWSIQLSNHIRNTKVTLSEKSLKMKLVSLMKRVRKESSRFFKKGSWDRRPHFVSSEEAMNSSNRISTMNDLPSPEGCWQKENVRKQIKNNSLLLGSALVMIWTIWIAKDIFPLQFNDPYYPLSKEDFPLDE